MREIGEVSEGELTGIEELMRLKRRCKGRTEGTEDSATSPVNDTSRQINSNGFFTQLTLSNSTNYLT